MADDNLKLFQVKFKDGGGERIRGNDAQTVKEDREAFWGDRQIVSVEEVVTKEP